MVKSNSVCPYLTSWMWSEKDYPTMMLVVKDSLTWNFLSQRLNFQCWVATFTHLPAHSPPLLDLPFIFPLSSSVQQPIHYFLSRWSSYFFSLQKQKYFIELLMFLLQIHPLIIVHQELVLLSMFPIQLVTVQNPGSHPWFFSSSSPTFIQKIHISSLLMDSTFRISLVYPTIPTFYPMYLIKQLCVSLSHCCLLN